MNFRLRSAYFALSVLPLSAGENLPVNDHSSKETIDLIAAPKPTSEWNFGFGLAGKKIGRIDFDTRSTTLTAPRVFGSNSFTTPDRVGPSSGPFSRDYDNGFVHPGSRTPATGRTSNYGYDTTDQIGTDRLSFYADGGERRVITTSNSLNSTGWDEEDEWNLAPYLYLNRLCDLGNGWRVGPTIQVSFTDFDGKKGGLNTLNASERRDIFDVRTIDLYDSTGLTLPEPPPGQPFVGSPGAVAPLLPAEPVDRNFIDTPRSDDTALFADSIQEDLEVNMLGVSIGADAFYQSDNNLITGIGAGLVVNIVDWDANRRDRLVQITNGGPPLEVGAADYSNSGTDVLFGIYLQGTLGYQINDDWSVEGNIRYDWSESLNDSVGGSDFDVDLSGFSLGLGATYSF